MTMERLYTVLDDVRRQKPLVHNITNVVVTNFTANGLLALGASPVMAYAHEEVADMAKIAGALVVNIGTLDERIVEAIVIAGQSANAHGVPVVFDPVGAGATPYRTEAAQHILRSVRISVLRGNAAEIANIVGEHAAIRGVDAAEGGTDAAALAVRAARQLGAVAAVTGPSDYVSDGSTTYKITSGTPLMTCVTGTGCLLSSVVGAFAAVERDPVTAATAAMAFYGAAGLRALNVSGDTRPGAFQIAFLDELHQTTTAHVRELAAIVPAHA